MSLLGVRGLFKETKSTRGYDHKQKFVNRKLHCELFQEKNAKK